MKKLKSMMVCLLLLIFLMGIPVNAAGDGDIADVQVSTELLTQLEEGEAKVGDVLQFAVEMKIPEDNTGVKNAFLRFIVCEKEDMSQKIGKLTMTIDSGEDLLEDRINQTEGMTTVRVKSGEAGIVKATVTLPVTEEMEGKTLYYQSDIRTDDPVDSKILAKTDVKKIKVKEDSAPIPIANVVLNANIAEADINNLPKNETFSIDIMLMNIGNADVSHLYLMSGYNENGWNDPESMAPFGHFVNLPSGVTEPEEGVLYIEKLKAQDKLTITVEGMISQDYDKENIAFSFAAMSYGKEDFDPATDIPIIAVTQTLNGKITDETEENPNPETPGKDDQSENKPADTENNKGTENQKPDSADVRVEAKSDINKNQVPKTGDESSTMAIFMIMAAAGMTAVIVRKKSKA